MIEYTKLTVRKEVLIFMLEHEQKLKGLSLKDLNAQVGQFAVWVDRTKQDTPLAQVVSKEYYDRHGKHTDRWGLAPTFFITQDCTFTSFSGILVDPDDPQFSSMVDTEGAKKILLDNEGLTARLNHKDIQEIMAQNITLRR